MSPLEKGECCQSAGILHLSAPQSWDQQEWEGKSPGAQHPCAHIPPSPGGTDPGKGVCPHTHIKCKIIEQRVCQVSN